MKGLIIKDFLNLKKSLKMFAIIAILYFFIGATSDMPYFFTSMLSIILAITTLSLFSYDDMAKWDIYALTMPISRESIIKARYLMMILLTLIGTVLSSTLTVILNIYLKKDHLYEGLNGIAAAALGIIILLSISFPFIIKLGIEKARIIFVAAYFVPFIITMIFKKLLGNNSVNIANWILDIGDFVAHNIYIIAPLIVLLVFAVSYLISIGIYRKKEL